MIERHGARDAFVAKDGWVGLVAKRGDGANAPFLIGNPIAGITSQSTASAQTTPGADIETDASLRSRMLQVSAAPPQGGDRNDYIEWALGAIDMRLRTFNEQIGH